MSTIAATPVVEWAEGRVRRLTDEVIAEEPMEIRIGGVPISVTMRTPGHDIELALGFLFTEGVLAAREDVVGASSVPPPVEGAGANVVNVDLRSGLNVDLERLNRHFFTASSCGVCGKASIEAVRARGLRRLSGGFRVQPEMLCTLPERLRDAQTLFARTGGLHAAALFDEAGALLVAREDVGRHNAVDKVVGWALANGRLPLDRHVLMVSGRGGFEIVQKAAVAATAVLACVSAPTSLAVALAAEVNLTLAGFLRDRRFVVYAGPERVAGAPTGGRRLAIAPQDR